MAPVDITPIRIGPHVCGDSKRLLLIAGPCVIESLDLCLEIAESVNSICDRLGVNYVFKASFDKANRTSAGSFRGHGLDHGLEVLAKVRQKIGCPVTTDVHLPEQGAVHGTWRHEVCRGEGQRKRAWRRDAL